MLPTTHTTAPPDSYTDFQGLSRLRVRAQAGTPDADTIKAVAQQFEALFVQMMIKSMRDAVPEGGLFDTKQSEMLTDLHDKQLGIQMSEGGGIGLAQLIAQQLYPRGAGDSLQPAENTPATVNSTGQQVTPTLTSLSPVPVTQAPLTPDRVTETPVGVAQQPSVKVLPVNTSQIQASPDVSRVAVSSRDNIVRDSVAPEFVTDNYIQGARVNAEPQFDNRAGIQARELNPVWHTPQQFVRDTIPHAIRAAKRLNIDPHALIAQSALETGWGRHVQRFGNEQNSFSMFGIKAGANWSGKTITASTREFKGGEMRSEVASFRAYDSLTEAFDDYAEFIQSSPRYHEAVNNTGDSTRYFSALQDAGYATDPEYANKIDHVLHSDALAQLLKRG